MKNKVFGLKSIIAIIVFVAIFSGITVGVILNNSYKIYSVGDDQELKEFLKVYNTINKEYYGAVDKHRIIDGAIEGMLNYLDDNYTNYIDKENTEKMQENLNGKYRGIGIIISNVTIDSVIAGSPADEAGLKKGDEILSLNGIDINNSEEITTFIKDNKEKSLTLVVKRGEEELTFTANIVEIDNPSVYYDYINNLNAGYIKITAFSSSVDTQFRKTLSKLEKEGITSLIIDLRNNKGGYLKGAVDIASMFLEKGKVIVSVEDKNSKIVATKDITVESKNIDTYILINEETASASEILTAALVDHGKAVTVGMKTFGKGKVQQTVDLDDGALAKYTSGLWYTPKNKNIDTTGISPTYKVDLELVKNETGEIVDIIDSQYEKVINLIASKNS